MASERTRPRAPPFIDPPGYARHRPEAIGRALEREGVLSRDAESSYLELDPERGGRWTICSVTRSLDHVPSGGRPASGAEGVFVADGAGAGGGGQDRRGAVRGVFTARRDRRRGRAAGEARTAHALREPPAGRHRAAARSHGAGRAHRAVSALNRRDDGVVKAIRAKRRAAALTTIGLMRFFHQGRRAVQNSYPRQNPTAANPLRAATATCALDLRRMRTVLRGKSR
jgi:hypothetical protein